MKKLILSLGLIMVLLVSCNTKNTVKDGGSSTKTAKLCALTFDDGPNTEMTPLVLDKLEKYHVVATFFMIGQLIDDSTAPVVTRIMDMNCEIGNHSWAWDGMNNMSTEEISDSVNKTTAAIVKYSGKAPHFFRPPNLATSSEMYEAINYPFASGVLGFDWAGCDTSAKERADNVLSNVKDGSIILLHDVQPLPHPTPAALDILIPALKKQGYEFVTLSELFERKGVKPQLHEEKMWDWVN